jgi:ParB family chromosome partitioning protein
MAVGLQTVPVEIVSYDSELDEREAIIEFNRQREKTFSQKMAEAEELKAIESERAERRRLANLKRGNEKPEVETLPPRDEGKTRDKVAAAGCLVGCALLAFSFR